MEVTTTGASPPVSPIETPAVARAESPPRRRIDPFRVVPSLSAPTATYGPRGEFPRPLLITLSYPVPSQTPFAGILPRDAAAPKDRSPDPPAAYRGVLASSFLRTSSPRAVDMVR